jgi:hypothetical protein
MGRRRTRRQRDPSASRVGPSHLIAAAGILGLLVMPVAFASESPEASKSASLQKQVKQLKKRVAALEAKPDQVGQVPASLPPSGAAGGALAGAYPNPSLAAPEPWHEVAAGSTMGNLCLNAANTAVFCSLDGTDPWTNFGGGLATAAFYKDQLGLVHLKGVVHGPGIFAIASPDRIPIFRLPTGYRPEAARIFPSVGAAEYGNGQVEQEAAGRIDVQTDGLVEAEVDCRVVPAAGAEDCSANGLYWTLDAVSFRPAG